MQRIRNRLGLFLSNTSSSIGIQAGDFALDVVQLSE
jgi:hypothetical protein